MELPNYRNGSIVNLMSSIAGAFGTKLKYKELELLPSKELKDSKNIVLMVFDGLGHEYLKSKHSFLRNLSRGKITSVFPPTTASAITTFATGTAPQQHASTGWYMHLKEIGMVSVIMRFCPRIRGPSFTKYNIRVNQILPEKSFSEKIKASSYQILPQIIKDSDFNIAKSKRSKRLGYNTLNGFFSQTEKAIKLHHRRKYIYAYWPMFDTFSHHYGVGSRKVEKHFREIDYRLSQFIARIKDTNTTLIITADHGFIDTPKERVIHLEDHLKLKECLTLPLCGDARTAYCYVHPSKTKQFEAYVKRNLSKICEMHKSEELVKHNYFGLGKPNSKLMDRIGDYTLLMKENYVLLDNLLNKKRHRHIGNHGGLSKEELYVPLCVMKC